MAARRKEPSHLMDNSVGDSAAVPKIAWISLICGILGWALFPIVPFGVEIVAIVLGIISLRQVNENQKKARIISHIGLWAGALKLLASCLMLLWVIFSFMRNPVAH